MPESMSSLMTFSSSVDGPSVQMILVLLIEKQPPLRHTAVLYTSYIFIVAHTSAIVNTKFICVFLPFQTNEKAPFCPEMKEVPGTRGVACHMFPLKGALGPYFRSPRGF